MVIWTTAFLNHFTYLISFLLQYTVDFRPVCLFSVNCWKPVPSIYICVYRVSFNSGGLISLGHSVVPMLTNEHWSLDQVCQHIATLSNMWNQTISQSDSVFTSAAQRHIRSQWLTVNHCSSSEDWDGTRMTAKWDIFSRKPLNNSVSPQEGATAKHTHTHTPRKTPNVSTRVCNFVINSRDVWVLSYSDSCWKCSLKLVNGTFTAASLLSGTHTHIWRPRWD